jgi:hypothetical protein
MADDRHYVPGDFYRICDLTGFKIRANRTKKQWNNYIVREQSFELRQPQDFVRGVRDDQTVPEPRPRQVNVFIQNQTTLVTPPSDFDSDDTGQQPDYSPGDSLIAVDNISIFAVGDTVSVVQDDGTQLIALASMISTLASVITLSKPLTWFASNGNIVFDLTYKQLQPDQFPASNGNY